MSVTTNWSLVWVLTKEKYENNNKSATSNQTMNNAKTTIYVIQIILSNLLIVAGSLIVLIWLLLASISFNSEVLMPWNAAGVLFYGLIVIAMAAIISLPGIVWATHIAKRVTPRWKAFTKVSAKIGTVVLGIGFITASAILIAIKF